MSFNNEITSNIVCGNLNAPLASLKESARIAYTPESRRQNRLFFITHHPPAAPFCGCVILARGGLGGKEVDEIDEKINYFRDATAATT
jgi:hypothetical protein